MENVFSRESFAKTRAQTEDVIAGWRPKVMGAVIEAFVKLHEKGLIYQGSYMVNWSPNLQTAVSDLEVYSEEPGFLYHIKYRVAGSPDFLTIATTRPETLFGDVAIAVHPEKMPTIQLWRENQKQAEVTGGNKAHFVVNEVREMIENDSIS